MHSILLFVTLLISGHDACQYASEHCPLLPKDNWLCGAWHNPDPDMDTACSQCCKENCCFDKSGTFGERYCGERSDDREISCQCTEQVKSNAWINHFWHPNGIGTITFTIIRVVRCIGQGIIHQAVTDFLIAVISPWIHPELPYILPSENIEPVWGAWAECAPRHHVKGIRVKIQVVFFPKITPKHEAV